MATTVTIEFTDAQWDLIQQHLEFRPLQDEPSEPIPMTVEQLSKELFTVVQRRVAQARIIASDF